MTCASCGSHDNESFEIPYAFFRHVDFEIIKWGGHIFQCSTCQLIWAHLTDKEIAYNQTLFHHKDYMRSQLIEHVVYNVDTDSLESRSSQQAKIIKKMVPHTKPVILDVGCFKGDLLRDLRLCYESADLHGFDVNEEFLSCFPASERVYFWSGDLSDIKQKFNIIILSASIMYIKDVSYLMNQIKRLLLPDGVVFIHAVDISQNPYALLLGDQFYHYTPTIMKNILSFHGFSFDIIKCNLFPKEFLGFAIMDPDSSLRPMEHDDTISWCLKTINNKVTAIRLLAAKYPNFGVLGTTSAAAFIDSVVQSNVKFFVDENLKRVGLKFHGKNVLNPSVLNDEDVVIIPYGGSSDQIKKRFSQKYKGKLICL